MNKEQIAFEKWYGGNHDNSTGIAEQLKEARWEAWQARAELDKQDTSEIVAEIDYELERYELYGDIPECDTISIGVKDLLTKIRKHLTRD